jgi:SNF family Na+-dependent transporter
MTKQQQKLTTKDWIWLSIFGTFSVVGFFLSLFGFLADFLNVSTADNWVKNAEQAVADFLSLPLNFLQWGAILMIVGVFFVVLILNAVAQREQVEREKKLRRAQRLQDSLES